ncbi:DUF3100 domain-containing protein (plasmid) [Agrobacterium leguminum]|uniref:DUF3100 domain-containing protein n=1 Tax=Agrobacterium leguminum TaxID=2792015 RepID=UPI00272D4496|nr:DUF3100 domain-containing protein [Agrobacterium leguminum]WLE00989.1 DUF3100 domain-containing protein [Agrobacterium leguminum]
MTVINNAARENGQSSQFGIFMLINAAMIIAVLIAEWIGNVTIPVVITNVVLFPIVWALIIGGIISIVHRNLPGQRAASVQAQFAASMFIQTAIAFFVVKLGFIIGESLPKIAAAGWALVFQELGHFVGTMVFALPLALLLGIKREAVGATFSIGREFSVAIISERYGMNSQEGRGVLAEYVIGTVLGALFIAFLAGAMTSLGIFHPWSLAMGAGVGSGSMMSAAVAAISAQHPDDAKEIAAFAAAANLLTTTVGTYFTLFLSLPMANWLYGKLEPVLSPRKPLPAYSEQASSEMNEALDAMSRGHEAPAWTVVATLLIAGTTSLIGNWIATGTRPLDALPAMIVMALIIGLGTLVYRLLAFTKVPVVCWISLVAVLATASFSPTAAYVSPLAAKVALLPLVTPVLAYAGLSLAKDLPILKNLGWRIVVVSLVANAGTFICGTLIAEFFH